MVSKHLQKIALSAALLCPTILPAEAQRFLRGNCLPDVGQTTSGPAGQYAPARPNRLSLVTSWDSTRVYPVAVILVSSSDYDFLADSTPARYDSIFNRPGYNEGRGLGCVADYFREQSGGLFKTRFDIYGPVKVASQTKKSGGTNYGGAFFRTATLQLTDSIDFDASTYDWDADGKAEAIVFIYAGYGGNEAATVANGCIWPNTSTFTSIKVGGTTITRYSASPERWSNDKLCGIGTICHEYSHTLGLPDIYPTGSNDVYSVCDEWDLMDGGNFTNSGWCPCNYSGLEKMLLGWAEPIELTEAMQISDMKPISEGGAFYRISCTDTEYYLLENRQWSGWDLRTPGHGLLVAHVDYSPAAWSANTLNNTRGHRRYEYFHADNLDYEAWDEIVGNNNPYVSGHSRILSTTPYPYVTDSTENRQLTDDSEPAATVFSEQGLMGKAITDIRESSDGRIAFNFMKADDSAVSWPSDNARTTSNGKPTAVYDLSGRKATAGTKLRIAEGRKHIGTN